MREDDLSQPSGRPGHDIDELIVFPGCLEGENCHDNNCKYNLSRLLLI